MLRPGDWIVMAAVLAAAALGFIRFHWTASPGSEVMILVDNHMPRVYSLDQDQVITVSGVIGDTEITVRHRKVWISGAPCPRRICMLMGQISREGESLVCLPNHVYITIRGSAAAPVDAVTQ